MLADIDLSRQSQNKWSPSPVSRINGQAVVEYLTQFAEKQAFGGLEPHSDWNQLMGSPTLAIQGLPTLWGGSATFYPGDDLVFLMENGTEFATKWYGTFHGDSGSGPLETGGDFYNSFVLELLPASDEEDPEEIPEKRRDENPKASKRETPPRARTSWNNAAYPSNPDILQSNFATGGGGFLSGYFIKEASIAVLSIPSFQERSNGGAIMNHSETVANFITSSKAAGMKRLVIDLQQNHGGDALLAYVNTKSISSETLSLTSHLVTILSNNSFR